MTTMRQSIAATRFGTGLRPGAAPPDRAEDLLAELAAGASTPMLIPPSPLAERAAAFKAFREARRADPDGMEMKGQRRGMREEFRRDSVARVLQRAFGAHPFFERLSAFWADNFTTSARGLALVMLVPTHEPEAIRPHVAGRFADLLKAAVLHPAMLAYLDQSASVGPNSPAGKRRDRGLNENLAREVLELHTLGADGPYSQKDVTEFAELLTGFMVNVGTGERIFRPRVAEPGAETVLGRSYGGGQASPSDAEAFLEDLAVHPGTARHLSHKLAAHFIADAPPADMVARMEQEWLRTKGELTAVYAAMLDHPAAWSDDRAKIRQPVEIIAAALRATGAKPDDLDPDRRQLQTGVIGGLSRLNQPMFRAPGPDGWPEDAAAWITPQGLAARLDWATKMGRVFAERGLDPRRYAINALGALADDELRFLVGAAAEKWEGFALALASPAFNRR